MATLKDVAKLAGVSYNTVSFVVNGIDKVAPETKARVEKAVKELNYKTNKTARALVSGKADSIAFIGTRFTSVFGMNILREIEEGVYLAGLRSNYDLIPYSTRGETGFKEQIVESIISSRKADAIIMLGIKPSEEYMKKLTAAKIPLVLIDEVMEGAHSVKNDNEKGAYKAVEFLINKGRRNIAYIGAAPSGQEAGLSVIERRAGYVNAHADKGMTIDESLQASVNNNYINEGYAIAASLLKSGKKIDAIFCAAGDSTAIGAIKAVKEAGLRVPEDIAIIGYDDIPVASAVTPALTTVRQPVEKMGNETFAIALEAMQGKLKGEKKLVFEPELVVRESA